MFGKYTHYFRPVWSQSTADDKFVDNMSEAEVEQWIRIRRAPRIHEDDKIACLSALEQRLKEGRPPFKQDGMDNPNAAAREDRPPR